MGVGDWFRSADGFVTGPPGDLDGMRDAASDFDRRAHDLHGLIAYLDSLVEGLTAPGPQAWTGPAAQHLGGRWVQARAQLRSAAVAFEDKAHSLWATAEAVQQAKTEHGHAMVLLGATAALTVADVLQGGADAATDVATASAGRAAVRAILGGGGEFLASACARVAVEFERLGGVARQVAAAARALREAPVVARYSAEVAKGAVRRTLVGGGISAGANAAAQLSQGKWNWGTLGINTAVGMGTGLLVPMGDVSTWRVAFNTSLKVGTATGVAGGAAEVATEMTEDGRLNWGRVIAESGWAAGGGFAGGMLVRAVPHLPIAREAPASVSASAVGDIATDLAPLPRTAPTLAASAANEALNTSVDDMLNMYWTVPWAGVDLPAHVLPRDQNAP